MYEFTSDNEYTIKDRGRVFTLKSPGKIPVSDIKGRRIIINDMVYLCKGIERFATHLNKPFILKDESIGLLVKEV